MAAPARVPLGQTGRIVSAVGAGTLAWGDRGRGYGEGFRAEDTAAAARVCLEGGVDFFDTAEVYGSRSIGAGEGAEQLLGDALAGMGGGAPRAVVATKYFPLPWTAVVGVGGGARLGRAAVKDALRRSLTRLGAGSVDLLYLHFTFPLVPGLLDAMADCVDAGLVGAIGVSNYSVAQLRSAAAALAARGVPLAANQFRFHLLDRSAEASGLVEETRALGATAVGYEPYARGVLAGALTAGLADPGRRYTNAQLALYKPLCDLMRFAGATAGGARPRSVPEVALAYAVAKGVVPIAGVKTAAHARDAVGALSLDLDTSVAEMLEEKADYVLRVKAGAR